MTKSSRNLRHAVRITLAACATTASGPLAHAQTAPAAAAPATAVQEVVVTGSRIQQAPNEVSISPVTSVTALDIQQTGLTRTEDLLNNLPQVIAENSSGQSISSVGTATVSLRGLGSWRTLVLINGRRLAPGAALNATQSASASADINQIPAALIERADVLTGGASAVYGADAVAGVVNYNNNTHYEGVKFDANYSFNNHKNNGSGPLAALAAKNDPIPAGNINSGANRDLSVILGSNFADGRGNATGYFTYTNTSPVVGYQYDYAGCTLNSPGSNPGAAGKKYACGGSSSSATGRFYLLGALPTGASTTLADQTVDAATGAFRGYHSSRDSYNYGALSYLQRQAERYTAGVFINFDASEHANVYSEFMFARNVSQAQYGPSGLFAFGHEVVSCGDNPLLTAQEVSILCTPSNIAQNHAQFPTGPTNPNILGPNQILLYAARRSVESGPRLDNYSSDAFREVVGVKGKFADAWSYDLYGQLGISRMLDVEGDFLGAPQVQRALDVVVNPATGAPACRSVVNGADPACVPWNIWVPGGVTQAALNYLRVQSSYTVKTEEAIVDGSVTGDLGKYGVQLPSAASGLKANFGAEYRQEKYDFDPDYIFANGFESGGNGAFNPVHATFHVSEVFTEFRLPILDDKPGAYQLGAEAGYRYSTYTKGYNTNTFKLGLEWAPIHDVRIRGGYNRAVRAPSIGDLYTPPVIGSGGTADPCWGPADPATGLVNGHDLAFCQKTGVATKNFGHILANPAAQINTSAGGNINLTPEIADTYTFGFVAQPGIIPNLVVSVDYYDIKINHTIESLTSNTIINDCGLTGDPNACSKIHRGPSGSLWFNNFNFVDANEVNIGKIKTRGIDVAGHYQLDAGSAGKLGFSFSGTHVIDYLTQPIPSRGSYDCAGYFGTTCLAPTPKWRHVLTTDWMTPWGGVDLILKWRYIGSSTTDRASSDPQLSQSYFPGTAHIGTYNYLDFSASVPVASTGMNLRLGVNNITDKSPPIVVNGNYSDCPNTSCNDNTWVGTYDTLGRYIYAHLSMKF
jgi:iron complex outermembrane receptor protein